MNSSPTVGDRVIITGSMWAGGRQLRGTPGTVVGLLVRVDDVDRNIAVHAGETTTVADDAWWAELDGAVR